MNELTWFVQKTLECPTPGSLCMIEAMTDDQKPAIAYTTLTHDDWVMADQDDDEEPIELAYERARQEGLKRDSRVPSSDTNDGGKG